MASVVESLIRNTVTKGVMKVAEFNRERMKEDAPNPFLSGLHSPMDDERTITDLAVTGSIPAELDGRYVRIGPNPVTPPNPAVYHWFTGDGMVHGVKLKGGKALWYRNRWIRTEGLQEEQAAGKALWKGLKESVRKDRPDQPLKNTSNTDVKYHAGRLITINPFDGIKTVLGE